MKNALFLVFLAGAVFAVGSGCGSLANVEEDVKKSSVGSIMTGETKNVEDFFSRVREQNLEAREQEDRARNQDSVRAFNLKTGKYHYVPMDSVQRWNEKEKRWEYYPGK